MATNPTEENSGRPAKRNRITVACTWCRQRKSRCDGIRPKCTTCSDHGYACEYSDNVTLTRLSGSKELASIASRLANLEQSFASLDGRVCCVEATTQSTANTDISGSGTRPRQCPGPISTQLDSDDVTTAEVQDPTDGIGSVMFTKEEETGFFGPSSNIAFTRLIVRTTTAALKAAITASSSLSTGDGALQSHMLHVSRQPSPVARSSEYGRRTPASADLYSLPPKSETLRLIEMYFNTTGILFPYIDKVGFLNTYHQLNSTDMRAVRRSWLGLLNMVLAMATSTNHDTTLSATERAAESNNFFQRALSLCGKYTYHGTSLEMVQMLLLMSQYLQGTEHSIETWNLHGLAVKAAYQLGLHSPKALKQYPPVEREIRKRTWYGCVVLDRSLSMTLGRPSAIPQKLVRLDLPSPKPNNSDSNVVSATDEHSVNFYKATITLYAIMGEILDDLYDSNVGSDISENLFDTASHLLQFERKFASWEHSLPACFKLLSSNLLAAASGDQEILRYQFILTVRFLSTRILAHRPLLGKYLEFFGNPTSDSQQLIILKQVGENSLRICAQSAVTIIRLMRDILTSADSPRHLLGAWWFSLHYTFNAALVIYSVLLVQHQAQVIYQTQLLEGLQLSTNSLQQAIECLSLLFKGNRMTEKCTRYTQSLAQLLSHICNSHGSQLPDTTPTLQLHHPRHFPSLEDFDDAPLQDLFDFPDLNDIHMGMSLENIFAQDFDSNIPPEDMYI